MTRNSVEGSPLGERFMFYFPEFVRRLEVLKVGVPRFQDYGLILFVEVVGRGGLGSVIVGKEVADLAV